MKNSFKLALIVCMLFSLTGCTLFGSNKQKKEDSPQLKQGESIEGEGGESAMVNTKKQEFIVKGQLIPGTSEDMRDPDYWIDKTEDKGKVIMQIGEIENFNSSIREKVDTVVDILHFPDQISGVAVKEYINKYKLPSKTMYDDEGKTLEKIFYNSLLANRNIEKLDGVCNVKYGIAIRRTNVRSFPTAIGAYDTKGSNQIDKFQETSLEPCEGAVILHTSRDGNWYFIQSFNYKGWVKVSDIALTKDNNEFKEYLTPKKFITVTGNHIKPKTNNEKIKDLEFNIGDKVPIAYENIPNEIDGYDTAGSYVIKLPERDEDGKLNIVSSLIEKSEDVTLGYLPYTRENIIREAFKFQGEKYDWGNKFNGADCSSFIMSVYRTFGFLLPRNTDEQEKGEGKHFIFTAGDSMEKRNYVLDKLRPGAAIYMSGHVMMYLGKVDGIHYIIHDFAGYGKKENDIFVFAPVYEVAVTSTLLPLSNGGLYIDKFTSAIQFEK